MKNNLLLSVLAVLLMSAFTACEKEGICSNPTTPAVIVAPQPMNSPNCCSHRHYTQTGFWYYCCKCGILHAAGSGVGDAFYTGDVLVGAQVDYIASDMTIAATVYTDEEGHWSQQDIPDGIYTVRFTMTGYQTVEVEDVEMENGETSSDMTVAMEPE